MQHSASQGRVSGCNRPQIRLSLVNNSVITLTGIERTVMTSFFGRWTRVGRRQLGHQSNFASEMIAWTRRRQASQAQQEAEMHARLAVITVDAMCRDIETCTDMCTDMCTDYLHRHCGCAGLVKQVRQSRCVTCFRVGASQLTLCKLSGCAILMKQVRQNRCVTCFRVGASQLTLCKLSRCAILMKQVRQSRCVTHLLQGWCITVDAMQG